MYRAAAAGGCLRGLSRACRQLLHAARHSTAQRVVCIGFSSAGGAWLLACPQMCTDGENCERRVCFFAHLESELREAEADPVLLNFQLHPEMFGGE